MGAYAIDLAVSAYEVAKILRKFTFSHAEWSLKHIPHTELYEAGFIGHFF
jgi:hypothetical protein